MNDITASVSRSIANPRRTTLVGRSVAEAAAPHHGHGHGHAAAAPDNGLQLLADDGAVCADGTCALPE